jgi:uncharacterized protein
MRLAGTHVLLTGATGTLGAAVARACTAAGADVTLVARGQADLDLLAGTIGGRVIAADLTDPPSLYGLIERVENAHGPVDVLVNNAGVETAGHFADMSAADVARTVTLNLTAPAELCRQALPGMLARGRGAIVNVSSLAGAATFPGLAWYGATKSGLTGFTAGLRADLRGSAIGTLVVEIGPVTSTMMDRIVTQQAAAASFDRMLRARLLTMLDPDDVARRLVAAVESGRPHLRLPRRAAPLAMMADAPRAAVRAMLRGIRHEPRESAPDPRPASSPPAGDADPQPGPRP